MKTVNVHEAKTHLSRLLAEVEAGGEIISGRAGTPVAVLSPYKRSKAPRKLGVWKGRVRMAADFDELPAELAGAFGAGSGR